MPATIIGKVTKNSLKVHINSRSVIELSCGKIKKAWKIVESILNNVKKNGDKSIRQYEKKFSGATISSLRVSEDEIKSAFSVVSKSEISAIRLAKSRVQKTESALKSLLKNF